MKNRSDLLTPELLRANIQSSWHKFSFIVKNHKEPNAKKSLAAGCNLVLYCSGNIKDNYKLIKSVPYIDKFTSKKTSEIYKILR